MPESPKLSSTENTENGDIFYAALLNKEVERMGCRIQLKRFGVGGLEVPVGIEIPPETSRADLLAMLGHLLLMERICLLFLRFAIGDVLAAFLGRTGFRRHERKRGIDARFGSGTYERLRPWARVAKRIGFLTRHPQASWDAHREVAMLPPDAQSRFLRDCVYDRMSAADVRRLRLKFQEAQHSQRMEPR